MLNEVQRFLIDLLAETTTLPEGVQLAIAALLCYAAPRVLVALGFDLAWLAGRTGMTALTILALAPIKRWWHKPSKAMQLVAIQNRQLLAQKEHLAALQTQLDGMMDAVTAGRKGKA